jgi:regulator of sigma E protease
MGQTANLLISILEFIIALGILAFLHELGHYLTSRMFKIEVEEFGFGLPPRALKMFRLWGTDFTLNWIPFGAFVRPKGENDPDIPGGLGAAKAWKRLVVLFGGPVMNLLTGVLIASIVVFKMGVPDTKTVLIASINEGSPAQTSGLQVGDTILSVNGTSIDSTEKIRSIVEKNLGQEVVVTVKRGQTTTDLKIIPRANPPTGQGAMGITMGNPNLPITLIEAVPYGFQVTGQVINQMISLPGQIIRGQVASDQSRVVGPVGMYGMFAQARTLDEAATSSTAASNPAVNTLWFLAVISIALGFTNLLPIPALDGGRILFILPEILFRKRVPPRYENMVHAIGLMLLLVFMVYVTAQDILNPIVLP